MCIFLWLLLLLGGLVVCVYDEMGGRSCLILERRVRAASRSSLGGCYGSPKNRHTHS